MVTRRLCRQTDEALHSVSCSLENLVLSSIVNPKDVGTELQEKLKSYRNPERIKLQPGKYLAMTNSEIVASGDTPSEAEKRARRKGFGKFLLLRIPDFTRQCE